MVTMTEILLRYALKGDIDTPLMNKLKKGHIATVESQADSTYIGDMQGNVTAIKTESAVSCFQGGRSSPVCCILVTNDKLYTGSLSGRVTAWSISSGLCDFTFDIDQPIGSLAILSNESFIVFTRLGECFSFNNSTLQTSKTISDSMILSSTYSTTEKTCFIGFSDGTLSRLNSEELVITSTWTPHKDSVTCLKIPDKFPGNLLSLSDDGSLCLSSTRFNCTLLTIISRGVCLPSRFITLINDDTISLPVRRSNTPITASLAETHSRIRECRLMAAIDFASRQPVKAKKPKHKKK